MHTQRRAQSGFFLIEVVVASAIITVVLILLLGSIQDTVEVSQRSLERTQASYLLEEGSEIVKAVRDGGWTSISGLTNGTTYYASWSGSAWSLTTTAQTTDQFTRTIVFSAVNRDTNDDIVTTGGTTDTGTKKVTVTVTWAAPSGTQTEALPFYLSDIRS